MVKEYVHRALAWPVVKHSHILSIPGTGSGQGKDRKEGPYLACSRSGKQEKLDGLFENLVLPCTFKKKSKLVIRPRQKY